MSKATYTQQQIDEILADYALRIARAEKRRPRDVSGASSTAPAEALARLVAKRDRFISMYVEVSS